MIRLVRRGVPTACMAVALCIVAQPAQAQEDRVKRIRFEAGYVSNHDDSDHGIGGAIRFGMSRTPDDRVRFEAGLIAGLPYAGLDAGVEFRFREQAKVGMLLRAGGGFIVEDGFTGAVARVGGGIELDVSPRVAFRLTAQGGYHGGQRGPHQVYMGFDYRW